MFYDFSTKLKNGLSVKKLTLSVEHPLLHRLDPKSIWVFLRKYKD